MLILGSDKEPFTLARYHEEIGKDFKRITLYLCANYDFMKAEGLLDDEYVDDEFDPAKSHSLLVSSLTNVSDQIEEPDNRAKHLQCNSTVSTDLTAAPTDLTAVPTVNVKA